MLLLLVSFVRARHVYGYEVVPQAISDARRNAKLNEIHNATFVQGDLNKIDVNFGKDFPKPDIVISGDVLVWFLNYLSSSPSPSCRRLNYAHHLEIKIAKSRI